MSGTAAEAPWLTNAALELVEALERSHRLAFGMPLLAGGSDGSLRQRAQELFVSAEVVLAHDAGDDPRLIYANRSALRLWRRPWAAMVGLPSRLTAAAGERPARARALARARQEAGLRGYGGIRVDSSGRRFQLRGARIWSLDAPAATVRGQAAAFEDWWWI